MKKENLVVFTKSFIAICALTGIVIDFLFLKININRLNMFRYFTEQSNLIIALVFIIITIQYLVKKPSGKFILIIEKSMRLWILMTGVVYHLLLAKSHHPQGILLVSNFLLHTFVPLGVFFIWLFLEKKGTYKFREIFYWISYPILYCLFVLILGSIDGIYPYFFVNPNAAPNGVGSYNAVFIWVLLLTTSFILSGILITGFDKLMNKILSAKK